MEESDANGGSVFTIQDAQGNGIDLYSVGTGNPVVGSLLSQHDSSLAAVPAIDAAGCNFMATLAYAQMVTGKTLSAAQYLEIWEEAVKNPAVLSADGKVVNPDVLSDIALRKLDRTDIGLSFGWDQGNGTLIGYRMQVPYDNNNSHYTSGDAAQNIVYNPGNTYGKIKKSEGVFVYAK
jgi:hypothetical protein